MLESLYNEVGNLLKTLLKRDSNTDVSCEICEIFKNTYFEETLRKTAFIDETSTECKASIFLNITVLFVQMQPYRLYIS